MKRKPPDEKYEAITIRLHPADAARLRAFAETRGLSHGAVVTAGLDMLHGIVRAEDALERKTA